MSIEYNIRNYQTGDYMQIAELWNQTGLGDPKRGDDDEAIEKSLKWGAAFFVMEVKTTKEIIGTSWITNDGRRLYLHHFGIKPSFQQKGLSKSLLQKTLLFAKEQNMQIKLEVHIQNNKAIQLYEKADFKKLGDYVVYIIREY